MKIHQKYISRCIQLAKNGLGTTYPNPLVGSVLVYQDSIIGEGWHVKAGQPHAEVHAIKSVTTNANAAKLLKKESDLQSIPHLISKATLYVSLEPCSHFGKTPPCADLIVASAIKNVVIGSLDPNPKVAGKGIDKLIKVGCKTTVGVLEKECIELNKRFFTFQNKKRPFIILKWAQTLDNFIAPTKRDTQAPVWITNVYSRQLAHKMRVKEQAILVGTNTVKEDNPSLTARDWFGCSPTRIVIDRTLSIAKTAAVFKKEAPTIIITEIEKENEENLFFETLNFQKDVAGQICDVLYKHNIQSIIIEGGTKTIQTFIDENIWDEAQVFSGNSIFKTGIKAPNFKAQEDKKSNIKNDSLQIFINPNL